MTDPSTVVTQGIGAATVVWVIQELKKAGWFPHLSVDTAKLNRVVSALGAIATGAAINWKWDEATHAITISGITGPAVMLFAWGALQQFVGQEMIYQLIYAPKIAAERATATQVVAQAVTVSAAAQTVAHAIEGQEKEKQ